MMVHLAGLIVSLSLLLAPAGLRAHALEPGFLEITPFGTGEWRVTWRKPQVGGQPMRIDAVLPETCAPRRGPEPRFDGRGFLSGWVATCEGGLEGGEIRIEGLERTRTDVLVRYATGPDAAPQAVRLTPAVTAFSVPRTPGPLGVAAGYFSLGVDHIVKGIDHLLFVALLLLLIRGWRPLLGAVTAFTLAHSLSLGAASLGWIVVPAPPVEAIVALSIVFLAAELAHPPGHRHRISERNPSTVAFVFGLLHGLGFASALRDMGLPEGDVPLALLAFNLGVEAGQLAFIAVALALGNALVRLYPAFVQTCFGPAGPGLRVVSYAMGALAAFWVIERVAGFVA